MLGGKQTLGFPPQSTLAETLYNNIKLWLEMLHGDAWLCYISEQCCRNNKWRSLLLLISVQLYGFLSHVNSYDFHWVAHNLGVC